MPRRRNTRRHRRRGSLGPLLRVLSVLLAAVAIVAALTLFFKVSQVVVTGNSRYTARQVEAVSGVTAGENLILLDKYQIAEQVYTQLPYITEVRISRKLPDTLLIEVTETTAVAAVEGGGSWWLVSAGGKLLESCDSTAAQDYLVLRGLEALTPAVSQPLRLGEGNLSGERLLELLGELEKRGMLPRAGALDAGDGEKLTMEYDGRFQVELPYDGDFAFKLDCLLATVSRLEPNESGIIRMTMKDDNEVRFIPYSS